MIAPTATVDSFLKAHSEFVKVYKFAGVPDFLDRTNRVSGNSDLMFGSLARVVIHQQLSGKVARVFEDRLLTATGAVSPTSLQLLGFEGLRKIGLSTAKSKALLDLSRRVDDETIDLSAFHGMADDEISTQICTIYGFGPWSAHMFLIFEMGRLNVWAPADLGVRKGFQILYDLGELPSVQEMQNSQDRYAPYSSLATWFFWRVLEMPALVKP